MKKTSSRLLPQLSLFLGCLVLALAFSRLYLHYRPLPSTPPVTQINSGTVTAEAIVDPTPRLIIPDLGINLAIYPAKISGNRWQTTTLGVSHLSTTPDPGEPGNSVIYGHNWHNLLGRLPRVTPGSKIKVTQNGVTQEFVVTATAEVDPTTSSVYAPTSDTRLTIYTCSGLLDSKRFVVVAKPNG